MNNWYIPNCYATDSSNEVHYTGWQQVSIWLLVAVTAIVLMMICSKLYTMGATRKQDKKFMFVTKMLSGINEGSHTFLYLIIFACLVFSTLSFFGKENFIKQSDLPNPIKCN